jgi:hypothetical protein
VKECERKYINGEAVLSNEFAEDTNFFFHVVMVQHKEDKATAQYDLEGNLYWKKHEPRNTGISCGQGDRGIQGEFEL